MTQPAKLVCEHLWKLCGPVPPQMMGAEYFSPAEGEMEKFGVINALGKLDIGNGFEPGVAIVILVIAVDRLSQALSVRFSQVYRPATGGVLRPAGAPSWC